MATPVIRSASAWEMSKVPLEAPWLQALKDLGLRAFRVYWGLRV